MSFVVQLPVEHVLATVATLVQEALPTVAGVLSPMLPELVLIQKTLLVLFVL